MADPLPAPSRSHTGNVALLIDADNASPDRLDAVITVLADVGTVNVRRAYGNWAKPGLARWGEMTVAHAIEPQQQFDVTKGKSATDMKMIVDAMDLLHGGRITAFGIMSSDSDFRPLVMRIRQDGLDVYGFGEEKTPKSFQQACTRFIDVGALRTAEAAAADVGDAKPPSGTRAVDEAVLALIGRAIRAAPRDEDGYAPFSEVSKLAGNQSSFDARNYGFDRLSDLVQSVGNFHTERRGTALYVKRVR